MYVFTSSIFSFKSNRNIDILVVRTLVLWDNSKGSKFIQHLYLEKLDHLLSILLKVLVSCEALIKITACIVSEVDSSISVGMSWFVENDKASTHL